MKKDSFKRKELAIFYVNSFQVSNLSSPFPKKNQKSAALFELFRKNKYFDCSCFNNTV